MFHTHKLYYDNVNTVSTAALCNYRIAHVVFATMKASKWKLTSPSWI